jgi:hypothetical protein
MNDLSQFKNSFKIMSILEKYSNNPIAISGSSSSSSSSYTSRLKYFKYLSFGLLVYSTYRFFKSSEFFNKNKKKELIQVKELPEHVKYDNGWYAEFDNLKSGSGGIGDGENVIPTPPPTIQEVTPRGDILMYYDVKNKEFVYYSNNKNLPYRTLDAVARKYVCLHNVPSIYIDIREEVKKGFEKCKNKAKCVDSATTTSSTSSSLYAVYKNYKSGTTTAADSNGVGQNSKKVILKDSVNKFIFKGRIDDYALDVKAREKKEKSSKKIRNENDGNYGNDGNEQKCGGDDADNEEKEEINISYSEFKKRNEINS